ncbi:MAG: hypothetical protein ABIO60_07050 [Aquaticitalea sp.]
MDKNRVKRNVILGILFLLPVLFLLFLYPAKHHYNTLDIVNMSVSDLSGFTSDSGDNIILKDHITVLGFLGKQPMEAVIAASNVKELVYDKFKGFKKFQVVMVLPKGVNSDVELLKKEIHSYENLQYWHFVFADDEEIRIVYRSLKGNDVLDENLYSDQIFIIDKDLSQRGRLDDRSDNELSKKKPIHDLTSYNAVEVAELKNKMSEDIRILFTEYRQKRKGNFDSSSRRANDLNGNNEQKK